MNQFNRSGEKYGLLFLAIALVLGNCAPPPKENQNTELGFLAALLISESAKQCDTTINNSSTFDLANPIELCRPQAGTGRHFRFENLGASANNGYLNLLIGYGARSDSSNFPTVTGFGGSVSPTTTSGDGRWRVFFGKSQSCDKALVSAQFSGTNTGVTKYEEIITTAALSTTIGGGSGAGCLAQNSGIWGPTTVCLDISKGSAGVSPRLTVWASGKNGADCNQLSTLTAASAIFEKKDWVSLVSTREDKNYVYRNLDGITATKVIVRSETAVRD